MSEPGVPGPPTRIELRLARLSFTEARLAGERLSGPVLRWWDPDSNAPVDERAAAVVAALGRSADPDGVLARLEQIAAAPAGAGVRDALLDSAELRGRLLSVLAASTELSHHLVAHPQDWTVLLGTWSAGAAARAIVAAVDGHGQRVPAVRALRRAYRRELVAVAGRDLNGELGLVAVTRALSDLADAVLEAGVVVGRRELPAESAPARLSVVAMGKAGARELNYVSDVDVIFVAEPQAGSDAGSDAVLETATRLAGSVIQVCGAAAWTVDAGLRPEGKDGPLVRSLASYETYYRRWANGWEFQALLKARPAAGDRELGSRLCALTSPMVWTAAERPEFVGEVRAMRRRVIEHIPAGVAEREIKLGRGGLRDVEFAVQLLQMVHGRADESLRVAATIPALDALREGGYVGRDDALSLIDAYSFLREVEHRLQLRHLRRTHVVPLDLDEVAWLARALGYRPDRRGDARAVFESEWALHAREVRRLHEKLFYRPLLEAVARVPTQDLRLSPAQARRRLAVLGFTDPDAALRHIESLTAGLTRRATLQRALLPVLLADFADAPDPDRGLLAYRTVSEQLGATPWYLRLLRDEGSVASRLAYLLGTSRYVARMIGRAPEALRILAQDEQLAPRTRAEIELEMTESAARQPDVTAAVAVVRGVRRLELLRIAFADLLGHPNVDDTAAAISATTEATLAAALQVARRSLAAESREPNSRFAIIAMGRLGGAEATYGSDADVLFVFDDADQAGPDGAATAVELAGRIRTLLAAPSSADPPLGVDAGLRPEGRDGPLARSLESYRQYYARWSSPWEAQALLRARFVAGDAELGGRFIAMIDPVRYPAGGIAPADLIEIRRLKARVDTERLPRGADPTTHTKLGRGGLADVEWTVQLLQLAHGAEVEGLRTPRTLDALDAAARADLVTAEQADALVAAWRAATHVRSALMLVRDRPEDQLPHQGKELLALGRALGYSAGFDPGRVVDDYRRTARRARRAVEEIFYAPLA